MNAGTLCHRCSLERDVITWTNGVKSAVATIYAENIPCRFSYLSGSEKFQAQQTNASALVKVEMRYRTDVLASHRVIYNGKKYEIIAPPMQDEERRASTTLECKGA